MGDSLLQLRPIWELMWAGEWLPSWAQTLGGPGFCYAGTDAEPPHGDVPCLGCGKPRHATLSFWGVLVAYHNSDKHGSVWEFLAAYEYCPACGRLVEVGEWGFVLS